jgi:hypothetical protein
MPCVGGQGSVLPEGNMSHVVARPEAFAGMSRMKRLALSTKSLCPVSYRYGQAQHACQGALVCRLLCCSHPVLNLRSWVACVLLLRLVGIVCLILVACLQAFMGMSNMKRLALSILCHTVTDRGQVAATVS